MEKTQNTEPTTMSSHQATFDFTITGRSKGDDYFSSPKNGPHYARDERKRRQNERREKRRERLNAISQERNNKQYFVESADEYEPQDCDVFEVSSHKSDLQKQRQKERKDRLKQRMNETATDYPPKMSKNSQPMSKTPTAPPPGLGKKIILNNFKKEYIPILEIIDITQQGDIFPQLVATGFLVNEKDTQETDEQQHQEAEDEHHQEAENEHHQEAENDTPISSTSTFDFTPIARAKGKKPIFKHSPKNGQMFAKDEKKKRIRKRSAEKKKKMNARKQARAQKKEINVHSHSIFDEEDPEVYLYETEWPYNLEFMMNPPSKNFTKVVLRPGDKRYPKDSWYIFHIDGGYTKYWNVTEFLPVHLENFKEIVAFIESHYEEYQKRCDDTIKQIGEVFGIYPSWVMYDSRVLDINEEYLRKGHLIKRTGYSYSDFSYLNATYVTDLIMDAIKHAGWI